MREAAPVAMMMAAALVLAGGSALAQTPATPPPPGSTIEGSGLAEACAAAAKRGDATRQAEDMCTWALDMEAMLPLDRAGTLVNRGVVKMRGKRYADAVADFNEAVRYKSDLAEAYVNRGAARIGLRQFKDSVADLDKALQLGVKEPEKAYYDRGLAYEWMENPRAAYLDYKRALEIAPTWDDVRQQLYRLSVTHAEVVDPPAPPAAKPAATTTPGA